MQFPFAIVYSYSTSGLSCQGLKFCQHTRVVSRSIIHLGHAQPVVRTNEVGYPRTSSLVTYTCISVAYLSSASLRVPFHLVLWLSGWLAVVVCPRRFVVCVPNQTMAQWQGEVDMYGPYFTPFLSLFLPDIQCADRIG